MALVAAPAFAENGHAAWLRYAPLAPDAAARAGAEVPRALYRLGDEVPLQRAEDELRKGVQGMLGRPLEPVNALPASGAVVVGTLASIRAEAEKRGEYGFAPMWAGQAAPLGALLPAAELTRKLAADALAILSGEA